MKFYCRLFGCTWVHRSEDPKISWNTTKNLSELALTVEGEPKFFLECQRCADRIEKPTRDQIKRANN